MTTNIVSLKTEQLKKMAMKGDHAQHTKIVKTLARRLKADPKKIRRQARTKFWQN